MAWDALGGYGRPFLAASLFVAGLTMSTETDCRTLSDVATSRQPIRVLPQRPRVAIVPAAGWGTRLRPLTDAVSKEMLPVGRKPALEHIVDELSAAGITQIVFVLSPRKEPDIHRYFGEGRGDTAFSYAIQPEMRGLGDAVLCAHPHFASDAPFLIALGDAVFEEAVPGTISGRLVRSFEADPDAALGVVVQRLPRARLSRYGVVKPVDPDPLALGNYVGAFAICDVMEKPAPLDAPSEFAVAARFIAGSELFDALRATPPGRGGEVQLTDALRDLLAGGRRGVAVPLQFGEARHDIGALDSYFRAFAAFALADAEYGAGLRSYIEERLQRNEKDAGK